MGEKIQESEVGGLKLTTAHEHLLDAAPGSLCSAEHVTQQKLAACRSHRELSGAGVPPERFCCRTDPWAWHFISHGDVPAPALLEGKGIWAEQEGRPESLAESLWELEKTGRAKAGAAAALSPSSVYSSLLALNAGGYLSEPLVFICKWGLLLCFSQPVLSVCLGSQWHTAGGVI